MRTTTALTRSGALLLLSLLLAACATTQELPLEDRQQTFPAGDAAVFEAVVAYLEAENYPLATVNREDGVITTNYKEERQSRSKINVRLKPAGAGQTRVTALMTRQITEADTGVWTDPAPLSSESRGRYAAVFRGIEKRLP